jgi:hypothetical protein
MPARPTSFAHYPVRGRTEFLDNAPTILDVTLRDGSYAADFQFTAADARNICGEL